MIVQKVRYPRTLQRVWTRLALVATVPAAVLLWAYFTADQDAQLARLFAGGLLLLLVPTVVSLIPDRGREEARTEEESFLLGMPASIGMPVGRIGRTDFDRTTFDLFGWRLGYDYQAADSVRKKWILFRALAEASDRRMIWGPLLAFIGFGGLFTWQVQPFQHGGPPGLLVFSAFLVWFLNNILSGARRVEHLRVAAGDPPEFDDYFDALVASDSFRNRQKRDRGWADLNFAPDEQGRLNRFTTWAAAAVIGSILAGIPVYGFSSLGNVNPVPLVVFVAITIAYLLCRQRLIPVATLPDGQYATDPVRREIAEIATAYANHFQRPLVSVQFQEGPQVRSSSNFYFVLSKKTVEHGTESIKASLAIQAASQATPFTNYLVWLCPMAFLGSLAGFTAAPYVGVILAGIYYLVRYRRTAAREVEAAIALTGNRQAMEQLLRQEDAPTLLPQNRWEAFLEREKGPAK